MITLNFEKPYTHTSFKEVKVILEKKCLGKHL